MALIVDYSDIQLEITRILKYGDNGDPINGVGFEFTEHTWEEIPSGKLSRTLSIILIPNAPGLIRAAYRLVGQWPTRL